MASYLFLYELLNGKTISFTVTGEQTDLKEITDRLTSGTFNTHIDSERKNATVINLQHVVSLEVTEI